MGPVPEHEPAGTRLRALREAQGLSRSELSRLTVQPGVDIGIAEITIRSIETGKRGGSPDTLERLARALDVSEDEFLEIRLARVRRLFDPREEEEGGVGIDAALANYERFIAAETPAARAMREVIEAAGRPSDRGASSDGASPRR